MLTEIYIEALLVDEELADQVWELWDKGEIDDQTGFIAWMLISGAIAAEIILFWSGLPVVGSKNSIGAMVSPIIRCYTP